ncbi:imidazole glycerol phosphate synthase subunit HisH [bacterium]|jgi:imidazole glycerol-phosphate synthase subunit HisH|nr:imidazole glycerol phosphate synthase subunit HisH [bacterium]
MVTIIDYGASNIKSVIKAFEHLGVDVLVTNELDLLKKAEILVCPGQGAFNQAIVALKEKGIDGLIKNHIKEGRPFIGICLGFQILFESSDENGHHEGLGVFPGHIRRFKLDDPKLKVPHMGWNLIEPTNADDCYFKNLPNNYVYFVHSYALFDLDKSLNGTKTMYGREFISSISRDNVLATQFHPEKSGESGLMILKNFLDKNGESYANTY